MKKGKKGVTNKNICRTVLLIKITCNFKRPICNILKQVLVKFLVADKITVFLKDEGVRRFDGYVIATLHFGL